MFDVPKKKSLYITITERCNLNCIYCYEKNKSPKKIDYRTARKIIKKEFLIDDGFEEMEIDFHGGEPFLEFDLIKKLCEYVWTRKWSKKYICYATTNGTLVHGDIKKWLRKNKDRFWCGLSLDGNKLMHDLNRSNSFSSIDLEFFLKNWPEQEVKMTISPLTLPYLAEGVKFIEKYGFKLSNNAAYGTDWSRDDNTGILEKELMKLAEYYLENLYSKPCMILDFPIERISFKEPIAKWCGTGTAMKAYSVDGDLYPCHFFDPVTIGKEKAELSKLLIMNNVITEIDPMCEKCVLVPACPTCYGSNFAETGNIHLRDKNLCKLNKISARATAYLWVQKFKKYSISDLKIDKIRYKNIVGAIERIRKEL